MPLAVPQTLAAFYDAVPYTCYPLPQSHPNLLAAAAKLQGMTPAPIENCRVLEIGCANGANILPMAAQLPRSQFLGIDISPRQIATGQEVIAALGLANIELRTADLMQLDADIGRFDYIICHGVYSWVPEPVQQRILELCARHLTAQGVAYISYSVYPGAYKFQALREMMQYHTAAIPEPQEVARQGRALVEFLAQNQTERNSPYAHNLRVEVERLRKQPLSYVSHDHLEPDNRPCYFHEFMSRAAAQGFQFLAEADKSGVELLPSGAQETLAKLRHDIVRCEQYIDFLRNSSFRSTLLCRSDLALVRDPEPQVLSTLAIRSAAQPDREIKNVHNAGTVEFSTRFGSASIEHPAFLALGVALLRASPSTLSMPELSARTSELLGQTLLESDLAEMVAYAYRMGFLNLYTQPPTLAQTVTEKPRTSSLARLQAQHQSTLTNLWHERVELDALERRILQKLDGDHDLKALHAELCSALLQGVVTSKISLPADAPAAHALATTLLPKMLEGFHQSALLQG